MTHPPNIAVDEEGSAPVDARDYVFIPPADYDTANQVARDMSGVQTGVLLGGVTIHNTGFPVPEPVLRRAAAEELAQVRREFVAPAQFDLAQRTLAVHRVVVLCGTGTGRTFTGRRLLDDQGVTDIADLDPECRLGRIGESDLSEGAGYLWDGSGQGEHPITGSEFQRAVTVARTARCFLVVVLDNFRQAPTSASHFTVVLAPPDPVEVAMKVLVHRCADDREQADKVLRCDLADALAESDPPEKAERAALLAGEVAAGRRDAVDALQALGEDADRAVASSLQDWSATEYSMSLAVALLEDYPFDEVAVHARRLDDMIRTAELLKDEPLRPRQLFTVSRDKLLDDVRAVTVKRAHPRHPGLTEETVRFIRQGWGDALLRHVWREYYVSHTVIRNWMCAPILLEKFGGASGRALCTLITGVSAHEPLLLVDYLASRHAVVQRELAVRVLNRLADTHGLRPPVEQILEEWVAAGSIYRKWTAALVYGSEFGRRDPDQALARLTQLGSSPNERVQNAVVRAMLDLLSRPEAEDKALNTLLSWLWMPSFDGLDCLHTVAVGVAIWVVGFRRDPDRIAVDPVGVAERYPDQAGILAEAVLDDPTFGPVAVEGLSQLAWLADAQYSRRGPRSLPCESAELVRLMTLLVPDLRWWRRRRAVLALSERHPARQADIRRIFRMARRLQRVVHSS